MPSASDAIAAVVQKDGSKSNAFINKAFALKVKIGSEAQDYVARGMSAYVEKVQEPEFAARDRGYSFVSHQQEVGTGYFDEVTTVIQGGKSSVTALTGSTEEEQFH